MNNTALPKIAMGAWAWGDTDGYFGNTMTENRSGVESVQFWEEKMQ